LGGEIGKLLAVFFEKRTPFGAELAAALAQDFAEIFANSLGNEKLRVLGPAVETLGELDFFFTERFAVGFLRVLAIGSAVAYVAVNDDELGTVFDAERVAVCVGESVKIVGVVYVTNIPPVGDETRGDL
jgi:hypothetical protein